MISTLAIKQAQLQNGFFTVGSGKEVILIMGSCRVCPYVNYFDIWNKENGNRFTIHSLDPFNFNWNIDDERVDYEKALSIWEHEVGMLDMLESVNIFIHEYYQNAGMFNVNKNGINNIYMYGLNPDIDICIPNFNDNFILANDILKFNPELRKKAEQDFNVIGRLSMSTEWEMISESRKGVQRFHDVCYLSNLPEMSVVFERDGKYKRYFHSYNHISKWFSLAVFQIMNEKYLHLNLSKEFMEEIGKEDMFANSYTKLTDFDIKYYGFDWGEEIVPLSL